MMKTDRLISSAELIDYINKSIPNWSEDKEAAIDCIKNSHEGIVRCRDCRYWERQEPYATIGKCAVWEAGMRSTSFCSEGRAKEDG